MDASVYYKPCQYYNGTLDWMIYYATETSVVTLGLMFDCFIVWLFHSITLSQILNFTCAGYNLLAEAISSVITGVFSRVVMLMYNLMARHVAYYRRIIQPAKSDTELWVMSCKDKQENVPPIINLLTAFNLTRKSPLAVSTVHLIKLISGESTVLKSFK